MRYERKASIIITSLRPEQLKKCLASIHEHTKGINYEVVVVSPFDIEPHLRVVHVKEEKAEGNYNAAAKGYKRAKGEYIIALSDDLLVTPDWLKNMLQFMKPHDNKVFQGRFRHGHVGAPERVLFNYWGYLLAPFPCMRKDKLDQIGGLFDHKLLHGFYGDPDLALRVWTNGGRVETCPDAWITTYDCFDELNGSSKKEYQQLDHDAFCERWEPVLGPIFALVGLFGLRIACPKCGGEYKPGLRLEDDPRRCRCCGEIAYTVMTKGEGYLLSLPEVSVIIPHAGPLYLLKRCIDSVRQQMPDSEIITVVDKPGEDVSAYLASLPHSIKVITHPTLRGRETALNKGLIVAIGQYLCFLMTDVQLPIGAIAAMKEALSKHAEFGWVALSSEHTGFLACCSMMTREAFRKVGLWDESYSDGEGFSDDDLMRRFWKEGLTPHIVEGVRVSHQHVPAAGVTLYSEEERRERFARNQALFKQRHGETGTNWDNLPRYEGNGGKTMEEKKEMVCLNLGSFVDTIGHGWWNVDILNVRPHIPKDHLFRQWDLRRGIPYPNDSGDIIRASHLLEHFTLEEAHNFCRELFRVLKPGGLARIATPDLDIILRHYRNGDMSFFNAIQPPEYIQAPTEGEKLSRILFSGDYQHKAIYSWEMLKSFLEQAGFSKIFRSVAGFSHAEEIMMNTVDQHESISLYVEVVK